MSQFEKILSGGVITGTSINSYNGLVLDTTNNVLYSQSAGGTLAVVGGGSFINVQGPQTALTTITTAQTMYTVTLPANAMNVVGKTMQLYMNGVFSNSATTPAITIAVKFGSVTACTIATANNANSNSSAPFNYQMFAVTTTAGSSGILEAHGIFNNCSGGAWAAGSAMVGYSDGATGGSSAINLTAASTITVVVSSTATLTSLTPQFLTVEVVN